jgi:hypothetical protein
MAIYVANVNGDWWEIENSISPVWILNTNTLSDELQEQVYDELGADKFEDFIKEHGKQVLLNVK